MAEINLAAGELGTVEVDRPAIKINAPEGDHAAGESGVAEVHLASGKTLADHRADRKAWLTEMLGLPATDPSRYTWELVAPGDQDHMPTGQRLLHVVADRMHWLQALDQARRRAQGLIDDLSATGEAA